MQDIILALTFILNHLLDQWLTWKKDEDEKGLFDEIKDILHNYLYSDSHLPKKIVSFASKKTP